MYTTYSISLQGRDHIARNIPRQDFGVDACFGNLFVAIAADGVGSCSHADIASKIAAETAMDIITKIMPRENASDADHENVIRYAMHGASNAIEEYADKEDTGQVDQYQTTLSIALIRNGKLYFGNQGDSGVIGIDTWGQFHVLTSKQNDENGAVFPIPMYHSFEVGTAPFEAIAAFCLTDGMFDVFAPALFKKMGLKYEVDVPFASTFLKPFLGKGQVEEEFRKQMLEEMAGFLQSPECGFMQDDLTIAAIVDLDAIISAEDLPWEPPQIDYYALTWQHLAIYDHDQKTKARLMQNFIVEQNPEWDKKQVSDLLSKYTDILLPDEHPDAAYEETAHTEAGTITALDCEKAVSENSLRKNEAACDTVVKEAGDDSDASISDCVPIKQSEDVQESETQLQDVTKGVCNIPIVSDSADSSTPESGSIMDSTRHQDDADNTQQAADADDQTADMKKRTDTAFRSIFSIVQNRFKKGNGHA